MSGVPAPKRSTTRTAVLPARRGMPELGRILPSGRSLLLGFLLLAVAGAAYAVARETSVFAVQTVEVRGGTPALRAQVRAALAPALGKSLLQVDDNTVSRALAPLPGVRTFSFDRAFPHTLRVVVHREEPVLILRQVPGKNAFLVAASGRVIRPLAHAQLSSLPRLWVTKSSVHVAVGEHLGSASGRGRLGPVAPARRPASGRGARRPDRREGADARPRRRARAAARRGRRPASEARDRAAHPPPDRAAAAGGGYLDVSVPERPVLSSNPQVGGRG